VLHFPRFPSLAAFGRRPQCLPQRPHGGRRPKPITQTGIPHRSKTSLRATRLGEASERPLLTDGRALLQKTGPRCVNIAAQTMLRGLVRHAQLRHCVSVGFGGSDCTCQFGCASAPMCEGPATSKVENR